MLLAVEDQLGDEVAAEAKGTGIAIAVDAKGVVDVSACGWSDQRDDGSAEGEVAAVKELKDMTEK